MKVTLNVRHLLAANLFASKEETRYYLNGVFVKREKGVLVIVATDGHRLAKFEAKSKGADFATIIPASLLKKIKVGKKSHADIELVKDGNLLTFHYEGASFTEKEIDGTFPDYTRVLPDIEGKAAAEAAERAKKSQAERAAAYVKEPSGFKIGFNPSYLGAFADVAAMIERKGAGIGIEMSGASDPARITFSGVPEFVGVLMPMRVF